MATPCSSTRPALPRRDGEAGGAVAAAAVAAAVAAATAAIAASASATALALASTATAAAAAASASAAAATAASASAVAVASGGGRPSTGGGQLCGPTAVLRARLGKGRPRSASYLPPAPAGYPPLAR